MSSFWRVGIVFLTFAAHILVFLTAREDFYMLLGLFTGAFWLYLLIIEEYDITDAACFTNFKICASIKLCVSDNNNMFFIKNS